jgi:hypothetical protein
MARDWAAARGSKREYWRDRIERGGLRDVLRLTDQLRGWMKRIDPEWPTAREREEDLQTHQRVAEALAKAGTVASRRRPKLRAGARRVR